MDKTIEIIMVIAVTVVVAGIVVFLVQGEAGSFDDFLTGERDSAQCGYWQNQYERTGDEDIITDAGEEGCNTGDWSYEDD